MATQFSYYIFYKPYQVLNQFTKERPEHVTLADYLTVESNVYPVGRLDKDSEGLLLLTNDPAVNGKLLQPGQGHSRTYVVQVEGDVTQSAVHQIMKGVTIRLDSGLYGTKPCLAKRLPKPPQLPERNPPIRYRASIPTSWVLITLTEGKNRQVRKMMAAVGFPVLRLVRLQIGQMKLGKLQPGEFSKIDRDVFYEQLGINQDKVVSTTVSASAKQQGTLKSGVIKRKSNTNKNLSFTEWRKKKGTGKRKPR